MAPGVTHGKVELFDELVNHYSDNADTLVGDPKKQSAAVLRGQKVIASLTSADAKPAPRAIGDDAVEQVTAKLEMERVLGLAPHHSQRASRDAQMAPRKPHQHHFDQRIDKIIQKKKKKRATAKHDTNPKSHHAAFWEKDPFAQRMHNKLRQEQARDAMHKALMEMDPVRHQEKSVIRELSREERIAAKRKMFRNALKISSIRKHDIEEKRDAKAAKAKAAKLAAAKKAQEAAHLAADEKRLATASEEEARGAVKHAFADAFDTSWDDLKTHVGSNLKLGA